MKNKNSEDNPPATASSLKKINDLESIFTEQTIEQLPFSAMKIYRSLLRICPASIAVVNIDDGVIYDVSDRLCRISGYSREELIGEKAMGLAFWADPENERQLFRELLLTNGECRNLEVQHQKKDGSIVTCLTSGAIVTIGHKKCVFAMIVDITAQKKAEEALLKERNFSDMVINNLPGFFFIMDEKGNFLRWNKNYQTVTGFTAQELRKMTVLERVCKKDRPLMSKKIKEAFQCGNVTVKAGLICKDGAVRHFLINGVKHNYDEKSCLLGAAIDIEDLKKAEEELQYFAKNLEDANTALKVLMQRRNEEQKEMEAKLQANINDLVIPYIRKLGKANLDERHKKYLTVLEKNLNDVLSPFLSNLINSNYNLTPQEIQVADLIKNGKNTKEIADILNASFSTVATHRNNIRKKLNLRNSKTNLCAYLKTLK